MTTSKGDNLELPANTPFHCVECDYCLTGLSGDPIRCPECGTLNPVDVLTEIARDTPEQSSRRQTPVAILSGAALLKTVGLILFAWNHWALLLAACGCLLTIIGVASLKPTIPDLRRRIRGAGKLEIRAIPAFLAIGGVIACSSLLARWAVGQSGWPHWLFPPLTGAVLILGCPLWRFVVNWAVRPWLAAASELMDDCGCVWFGTDGSVIRAPSRRRTSR